MINRKILLILSIFMILVLGVVGCSFDGNDADTTAADSGGEQETITIKHMLGEATLERNPENIVVFDYAILDTLDELGIEIRGLPKANIPDYLKKFNTDEYEDIGTLFEPNFEKIFELEPDVIFISGRQAEVYEELAKIAPTIYLETDGADYMNSMTHNLNIIGNIFDRKDFIEDKLAKINKEIEHISDMAEERDSNALIVLANDGAISAYGEGSRFGIIHKEFGFEPIDKAIEVSNHGQNITFEYILEKDPEYIFVVDRAATTGGSLSAEQIFDNEIIKQTRAYSDNKIIYLSSQVWYVASGGLRGTSIMIEDIRGALDR
ncbi:MAG TPA: siderophore ABC transporter substrate-binding protein [Tepidimicrobium sp.]|nr:siderophore ABC transporter substrate-binding protein [Tepidimicrobium sp.]